MLLNDLQVWTLIGVFTTMMLGGMTVMTTQFSRVIRAEVGGLRAELTGRMEGLEGRLTGRIDALENKVDGLDREVANLAARFWRSQ
ncbi:hypothetical protein [Microbacterium paraoxydans]|uniref:hypothetical protein n=1 Tax=Microbacterium paraoxydans TaxID=199592 RepID=UPI003D72F333